MTPQVSASWDSPTRNVKPVACFWLTDASLSLLYTIIFRSAYRPVLTSEDSSLIEVLAPPPSFFRLKPAFRSVPSLGFGAVLHHPHLCHTTPTVEVREYWRSAPTTHAVCSHASYLGNG